ncbi:MAG TPA: DUF4244 domain-containing protein [Actinomycetota bacterium]|jgi:Protein of unknown function (DUF4244)|nr:DUF4244 domain-containing protein [Actinomycetota bacterium]
MPVLRLYVRIRSALQMIPTRVRSQSGQSTAEYALVILAAAAIALVLLAWARSSGKLPAFFDSIIDRIVGESA